MIVEQFTLFTKDGEGSSSDKPGRSSAEDSLVNIRHIVLHTPGKILGPVTGLLVVMPDTQQNTSTNLSAELQSLDMF